MYRCRAVLLPAFIQQLAVAYVANGYWFCVPGWIPVNKDPEAVDRKLIEQYGIDISKWERARCHRAGCPPDDRPGVNGPASETCNTDERSF